MRVRRNNLKVLEDLRKIILRETRGKIDNTDQKQRDQANFKRNNLKLGGEERQCMRRKRVMDS